MTVIVPVDSLYVTFSQCLAAFIILRCTVARCCRVVCHVAAVEHKPHSALLFPAVIPWCCVFSLKPESVCLHRLCDMLSPCAGMYWCWSVSPVYRATWEFSIKYRCRIVKFKVGLTFSKQFHSIDHSPVILCCQYNLINTESIHVNLAYTCCSHNLLSSAFFGLLNIILLGILTIPFFFCSGDTSCNKVRETKLL